MPGVKAAREDSAYCLLRREGSQAGLRYELRSTVTRIGRGPDNDVVIAGPDASIVSGNHAEIRVEDGQWLLRDLDSTNGTFIDGERVVEARLSLDSVIQLGPGGPTLTLTTWDGATPPTQLDQTIRIAPEPSHKGLATTHDRVLNQAVFNARRARWAGALNQTGAIMREAMASVLAHSARRFRRIVAALAGLLVAVTGTGAWKIESLRHEKAAIDSRIATIERGIDAAVSNPTKMDRLLRDLDRYQGKAEALERSRLYRWSAPPPDPLDAQIRTLLAEFGAEVYSIPPDFRQAVSRELARYQGPGRPLMAHALGEARPEIGRIARILEEHHLPPDFAYMVLVESALDPSGQSAAGGAGLWQLTPATARTFGLRVSPGDDERLSLTKSTGAAAKYIRGLILDFGAGSSVMLALAAYDVGQARVKHAIQRVTDPIKQRDFWYLYRTHALPEETREYVPKVIAAMIIGREPAHYGF